MYQELGELMFRKELERAQIKVVIMPWLGTSFSIEVRPFLWKMGAGKWSRRDRWAQVGPVRITGAWGP